ncbi:DNA binding domain-containing protein, excisionase family [Paenibacillus sp. UNCCL117]|uniref:helix-turn-helix domain-containing protein n=1 Tax=unclassified Paenibacillus TaxID=185978 RepID=UPI00088DAEB7|nr:MULTISPECIES: helix-turn-helix domain-containing protein [unclassified Paenibacillus]SDC69003.1 DNA binding domain-containing protein, excisionase family [Paenibacillus sp. cl123]SFW23789.1 DNA binding domain-containing protein, excisionase family [Paenibacillus sp. UNCCL117]
MERDNLIHTESLPDILNPQQVARFLGISRNTVYGLCSLKVESGGIQSFSVGKSRRIKKSALLEWIDRQGGVSG